MAGEETARIEKLEAEIARLKELRKKEKARYEDSKAALMTSIEVFAESNVKLVSTTHTAWHCV